MASSRAAGLVVLLAAAGVGAGGVAVADDGGTAQVGIVVLPSPGATTTAPTTTAPRTLAPIVGGVTSPAPAPTGRWAAAR